MKLLITGGYGFVGSNLIRQILVEQPHDELVNLDLMTYAANPDSLAEIEDEGRYRFVRGDVADRELIRELYADEGFDAVIHAAAESHVDRSLIDPTPFLRTNIEGTVVLLEAAREFRVGRHVQVSTDEVYGSLADGDPPFTEANPLAPHSPYSASKAAADQLALAFHHSYGLDVVVTRCSNNYGPYQHPEKLIPLAIAAALAGRPIPLYGDGRHVRDWIHVEDHCRGLISALRRGRAGEVYNFGGAAERMNLEVLREVVGLLGADESLITPVADRPGHDRRYAIDHAKARAELGWSPRHGFSEGLRATVTWYAAHPGWWRESAEAAYRAAAERLAGWSAGAGEPAR